MSIQTHTRTRLSRWVYTHTHPQQALSVSIDTYTHSRLSQWVHTHTLLPHCAALLGKLRLTPSSPGNRFSAQSMNIKMSSFFTLFPLFMHLSCCSSPKHDKNPTSSEAQYVPCLWEPPAPIFLSQKACWPGRAHWKMQSFWKAEKTLRGAAQLWGNLTLCQTS